MGFKTIKIDKTCEISFDMESPNMEIIYKDDVANLEGNISEEVREKVRLKSSTQLYGELRSVLSDDLMGRLHDFFVRMKNEKRITEKMCKEMLLFLSGLKTKESFSKELDGAIDKERLVALIQEDKASPQKSELEIKFFCDAQHNEMKVFLSDKKIMDHKFKSFNIKDMCLENRANLLGSIEGIISKVKDEPPTKKQKRM